MTAECPLGTITELSDGRVFVTSSQNPVKQHTGFEDRTESTMSFVDGTRTFSIQPTGTDYIVWAGGRRYIKDSTENVVISDTEGLWVIYFDRTTEDFPHYK